ncbi:MAG: ribosome-associated translation inhibitor RaiA [Candidatus Omnitrophota bacterium]|nr:MAG: ribosome-associated translation inhibitor RaiA [Candidatus Omnitrophota bacterium]
MEIIVNSVHVKIDKKFEEYIKKKIEKLKKFIFDEGEAKFILKKEGDQYISELSLHTKYFDVFVKENSENLNESVEILFNKAKKKLRRLHEKVTKH